LSGQKLSKIDKHVVMAIICISKGLTCCYQISSFFYQTEGQIQVISTSPASFLLAQ